MATGFVGNKRQRLYVIGAGAAVPANLKKAALVTAEVEAFLPAIAATGTPSGTQRSAGASISDTHRFVGVTSRAGGGRTQTTDSASPWSEDIDPVPLGGEASFNEVTVNGMVEYDDAQTTGLSEAMDAIDGLPLDREVAVIVESKPVGLNKFVYRVEVGLVSTTGAIDDANPTAMSFAFTPSVKQKHVVGSV